MRIIILNQNWNVLHFITLAATPLDASRGTRDVDWISTPHFKKSRGYFYLERWGTLSQNSYDPSQAQREVK